MRTVAALIPLILLWAVGCAGSTKNSAAVRPLDGHPGNIFLHGEVVSIALAGAGTWEARDYDGKIVASGELKDGRAELGTLPVGYYEVKRQGDADRVTVGVIAPLVAATPEDTPIASDVAMAWFYPDEARQRGAANLCRLAGIVWVRDRLNWMHVEPKKGEFAGPGVYDASARVQSEAGLKVLQVNHLSPPWANPEAKRFPLDLRDAYNFHRAMAIRWKNEVPAFEPWNEADIEVFGGHTGSEMAAMQKASYLGLKAGRENVIACLNVFAHDGVPQLEDLAENEAWPYFDTYNLHHYVNWERYPEVYAHHRAVSAGRPMWVTEFNVPVKWEGDEKKKEPSAMMLRAQAQRVGKVFASSLNEGPEKAFFFILGHYVEGQTQFGIVHEDLTPRPAYLALAAAGRMLAGAKPAGKVRAEDESVSAFAFHARPDGERKTVIVAWSQKENPLWRPAGRIERVVDGIGRKVEIESGAGVKLGTLPVFIVMSEDATENLNLDKAPAPPARLSGAPSNIVFQPVMPKDRVWLAESAYRIAPGKEEMIPVMAYNFGDAPASGTVSVASPEDWTVEFPQQLTIAPGERKELSLKVTAANSVGSRAIKLTGRFGDAGRAVMSIRLTTQPVPATKPAK